MRSIWSWATVSALVLFVVGILSGCGGATGLPSGAGATVGGSTGTAGASGISGAAAGSSGGSVGIGQAGSAVAAGAGGQTPSATLVSVAVTPVVGSAAVGTKLILHATGMYSDNSTRDVTAQAAWKSSSPPFASVAGGVVTAVAPGTVTITAALEGLSGSAQVTVPTATVVALTVTPATATTAIQGSVSFQAVVTLSDKTTQDVTDTASWTSSDAKIASVSTSGVATGIAAGTSTITAAVGKISGTGALTVTHATLVSIAVTPTNPMLGVGVVQQFLATGTFSDGTVSDVSSSASFTSSAPSVAKLDAAHSATTLAAGTTTITATIGKLSGSTTLTVSAATLISITVTPATTTLAINGSAPLTATGTFSDNSRVDLTASVTWSSTSAKVAVVSNAAGSAGSVTGLSAGNATITASLNGVSGSGAVTVTAAALVSIAISPQNPALPLGTTLGLTATGTYSDKSTVDITTSVTWSSDTPSVATVNNANGKQGSVTALKIGTSLVYATLGQISASTTVTVTAAKLVSLTLAPANPTLAAGTSQALTATANYSDGSSVDVTTSAVWSSDTTTVATVSNAAGSQGNVTAIAVGKATIAATFNGVAGSTTVTVSAPTLVQIVIAPIADSVRVGATVRYTATGIYSNNTQQRLAQGVIWSSSDAGVATIAAGGMGGGEVATAVAAGITTISASYQGVTGSTSLTVTNATVVAIEVTPTAPALTVNGTQQLTATAIYDDNTQQDVTNQATWISKDPTVAQVTTAGGGPGGGPGRGRVTAIAAGTTTISATLDGLSGSTVVTVTSATIASIELTPTDPSVAVGTRFNFTATAIYTDNTSQNVTGRATWISSSPNVASVSTAGGARGQAVALVTGTTTISASVDGSTGTTTLTVTDAILTTIQVTPFSPTLPVGFNANLIATGIYSDNTARDLTGQVTWTSSAPSIATVSDAGGSRGLLSPVSAGNVTITATYQGLSGTDTVVVSAATLSSIKVTPATASIGVHATQPFVATGTLSDATTLDVTPYVTWLSTTPSIASISNAAGTRGTATGLSAGSVTISAVRGAVTGAAKLTVN
jgi:trimeric autotransporter adhesin